tara:strand:- start:4736 stop:6172 length:1437 start_codon:yes stop_codon:yes gene_type:complete
MRIVNFEINELPPQVLNEYINKYPYSNLGIIKSNNGLKVYVSKANDISKDKLYPSQTWASFNTGIPYEKHKCYWYSDPIDKKELIWNKIVSLGLNVGIVGSLHSSKYPDDFNDNYKFYIPDCFSDSLETKPKKYSNFQAINSSLVADSARVTSPNKLVKTLLKNLLNIIINPRNYGISFLSIKMIMKIIFWSIRFRNKEFLRMAQFPLYLSILKDRCEMDLPEYSSIFSNHLAGNMHRYWYAHKPNQFSKGKRYSDYWINRNQQVIDFSMHLLDDAIGIFLKSFKENITIIITSSMGQEANPNFDNYILSNFDGKIVDIELFLKRFKEFQIENSNKYFELEYMRNMAPQYGFNVSGATSEEIKVYAKDFADFLINIDLKSKIDIIDSFITLTIDPATNMELQRSLSLKQAQLKYKEYGFQFTKIEDHHSGAHCEDGVLALIGDSELIESKLMDKLDDDGNIDYLKVSDILIDSLIDSN